ncbi:hypothetical protein [Pendulispora albinea]|uniref:Lipoprotein n=1 Tax=Pendulispora albinea TaxID=2741071 RepID=A0ABZ2M7A1_9BACT
MAALIAGFSLTGGCSSAEEPQQGWTLNENARLAPRAVSDVADVEENAIVLARTKENEDWAKELSPGNTIAGNYDTRARANLAKSKNRRGFLRKVVSVEMGDDIVITTEPAQLYDLIQGRVHMDDKAGLPIFPDAPRAPATQAQNMRLLGTSGGKTGPKNPTVGKLEFKDIKVDTDGDFQINPHFEADFEVQKEWIIPTGVKGHALFEAEAIASASIAVSGTMSETPTQSIDLIDWPDIPIGETGLVLEVKPQLYCDYFKGAGKFNVKATGTLTGKLKAGFDFDGTNAKPIAEMGLKPEFSLSADKFAPSGISVSCGIKVDATLWALGSVGISLAMGPKITITANNCTTAPTSNNQGNTGEGVELSLEPGLYVTGKLKAKTPIVAVAKIEATLFEDKVGSFGKAQSGCCTFGSGIQLVCSGTTPLTNP